MTVNRSFRTNSNLNPFHRSCRLLYDTSANNIIQKRYIRERNFAHSREIFRLQLSRARTAASFARRFYFSRSEEEKNQFSTRAIACFHTVECERRINKSARAARFAPFTLTTFHVVPRNFSRTHFALSLIPQLAVLPVAIDADRSRVCAGWAPAPGIAGEWGEKLTLERRVLPNPVRLLCFSFSASRHD